MELNFTPRLYKGRHLHTVDEAGPFCLVEAVGYNVDHRVDDCHPSVDPVLAGMARALNDRMCNHLAHPTAEFFGMIAPDQTGICDTCQGRLWAVGRRIAGTGIETPDWSEAELAAVHVSLALEAAMAVSSLIDASTPLRELVNAAISQAAACLADASHERRAAARVAASRVEHHTHNLDATPAVWAAHTAVHATRAAAAVTGDAIGVPSSTYFFANRRCIETMTYALGATAGDPAASMRIARRVLNAFGKATSQKATPGAPDVVVTGAMLDEQSRAEAAAAADEAHAAAVATLYANLAADEEARAAARRERNRTAYAAAAFGDEPTVEMPLELADRAAFHLEAAAAGVWGGDALDKAMGDAIAAAAAAELEAAETAAEDAVDARNAAAYAAATAEETGDGHGVVVNGVWYGSAEAARVSTEETGDVDDFDASDLADVADEAIGDAAGLEADLRRAETMLSAIAQEHRPVRQLVRTTRQDGADPSVVTEYYQDCCVMCRDAKGRPVPSPCRTASILQSYGEV